MERRTSTRVSEAQWLILLDYLESHPNLARTRGYNNTAQGRAETARLWQELANLLHADRSGCMKTPKDWAIYISNYKSKLKKIVAGINADASGTGGGPPRAHTLSELDQRFLALMGVGFGQTTPGVRVNPFPDTDSQHLCSLVRPVEHVQMIPETHEAPVAPSAPVAPLAPEATETGSPILGPTLHLPRRARQRRHRSQPLAPLDEARRILTQVEMRRVSAENAQAEAFNLIGQNLGRIAHEMSQVDLRRAQADNAQAEALLLIGQNLGRIADAMERSSE